MRCSCSASLLKSTVSKARLMSTKRMPQDSLASSACTPPHSKKRELGACNKLPLAKLQTANLMVTSLFQQTNAVLLRNTSHDIEQCNAPIVLRGSPWLLWYSLKGWSRNLTATSKRFSPTSEVTSSSGKLWSSSIQLMRTFISPRAISVALGWRSFHSSMACTMRCTK